MPGIEVPYRAILRLPICRGCQRVPFRLPTCRTIWGGETAARCDFAPRPQRKSGFRRVFRQRDHERPGGATLGATFPAPLMGQ